MQQIIKPYPRVAIIGRTNVGKSTLFNRLTENRRALISAIPGTTRDRRDGECYWQGKTIILTDTAGLDVESDQDIDRQAVRQAKEAISAAAILLLIVNVKDGLLPQDKEYARLLKKSGKPIILVINKVDSQKFMNKIDEFYKLGIKDVEMVSAKTGAGTGDLLDSINQKLGSQEPVEETPPSATEIRIAIIGKPNVGKSSLLNKIVGEEKSIVSPIPHTTRDSQDVTIEYRPTPAGVASRPSGASNQSVNQGTRQTVNQLTREPNSQPASYRLTFVDTAGIIKHRKINDELKEMSIEQSLDSLRKSQIVLLVIDASEPVTMQDKNLAREILENNKSLIFVINKWDLLKEKTTHSDKEYIEALHRDFPFLTWAPVIFISAKSGFKIARLVDAVIEIYQQQHQAISQTQLDKLLHSILKRKAPPLGSNMKRPYLHSLKQISTDPLTFEITATAKENIPYSYHRYIKNELREKFHYTGCGLKLVITDKE